MTWDDLTPMAKFEVVVDGDQIPALRDLLLEAGATGFTTVSGVSGFGHHGYHEGRLLFDERLSILITVVPKDRVRPLVVGILRLLEGRHGVFFVTETHVSRADYFH